MIIASAVKLKDGRVFVGKRHGDCYAKMAELKMDQKDCNHGATQGFITEYLLFLNREYAYYEALNNNQCEKQEYNGNCHPDLRVEKEHWKPCLISENLW